MKLKKLTTTAAAAVFMSAVSSVNASSMWLETSTPNAVNVGDTIELSVEMDFSDDPTTGGFYDIIFDPKLVSYNAETLITDPGLGSDPFFTIDDNPAGFNRVDVQTDRLAGAAFGAFSVAGLVGPALIAPVSFTRIAEGEALFDLDAYGFFANLPPGVPPREQFPDTRGVTVPEVPVPAAAWLFGSGLLGLVGMARRRTTA